MPSDHDNPRHSSTGGTRRSVACLLACMCFVLVGCQASPVKSNLPSANKVAAPIVNSAFDTWLAKELDSPPGAIPQDKLNQVKQLTIPDLDLKTLDGLEKCVNLESLTIESQVYGSGDVIDHYETDLAPIAGLKKLKVLKLAGVINPDLSLLRELTAMEEISIDCGGDVDLAYFSHLTSLRSLYIYGISCDVLNWEQLRQIQSLRELSLISCGLTESELAIFLPQLVGLEELSLNGNRIASLEPVEKLHNLRMLNVGGNPLDDVLVKAQAAALRERGVAVIGVPE